MRQAERYSEEGRRNRMYGFPSVMFASLTCRSIHERLEALGHDEQDMKWADDTDWGKLFTGGGEINETCTHSLS